MSLTETLRERRGHPFVTEQFLSFPRLYSTEEAAENVGYKTVWAHFFVGDCDWWLIEYDPKEHLAFGFVSLGSQNETGAEFGYFSLVELEALSFNVRLAPGNRERTMKLVVERDVDWSPRAVRFAVPERFHKSWWLGE